MDFGFYPWPVKRLDKLKAIEVQVEQRFRIHATLRTKIFAYIKSLSSNMGRWQAA